MAEQALMRDYSVTPESRARAKAIRLADAEWYQCPISRAELKELMKRKDWPGIRDTIIWFGLLAGLGWLGWRTWGTWWMIPVFLAYGVVYITPAGSKWHEFVHGTVFKTPWLNDFMFQVCSVMIFMSGESYRWSHALHHTDTIILGSDPEIQTKRPPVLRTLLLGNFRWIGWSFVLKGVWRRAMGRLTEAEMAMVPENGQHRLVREARMFIIVYGAVIALCLATRSILPAMYVGLPILYGSFLLGFCVLAQHGGLHENVLDHRLNTRTFKTNIVIRFLYSNMNYHLEHHMFPMVPYHALPKLHEKIKHDCPAPNPSFLHAVIETMTALWRQRQDPDYTIHKPLPGTARPYKYGPAYESM